MKKWAVLHVLHRARKHARHTPAAALRAAAQQEVAFVNLRRRVDRERGEAQVLSEELGVALATLFFTVAPLVPPTIAAHKEHQEKKRSKQAVSRAVRCDRVLTHVACIDAIAADTSRDQLAQPVLPFEKNRQSAFLTIFLTETVPNLR